MLLGPGQYLEFRKKVRRELRRKGYNVIIMEEVKETEREPRLEVKFQTIMNQYEPIFVAFFLEEAKNMEGVIFEIGCICCRYTSVPIGDILMLLSSKNYDWDRRTPYMNSLIPRVTRSDFDEGKRHSKASERIDNFVLGLITRRWLTLK